MNTLPELRYSSTDEWVKVDGDIVTIGVSDYAQSQLSDVVYIEIKVEPGDKTSKGDSIVTIESVKAAADVNSPVSGEVLKVNEALNKAPETVNTDPYGNAWMVKIKISAPVELSVLMDETAYISYCEERGQ